MDSSTFRFGPYAINRDEKLLRRAGEPVPLPLKAVETLLLLVQSPGRVVWKEDIMRAVWPDAIVEENNLTQQISLLRKALGNGAEGGQWIQTVPKRGYRFVPPEPEPVPEPVPVLVPVLELGLMKLRWILAAVALIALTVGAGSRLPGDAP
ncbi:MAG TPA: transcriptional regulator [Thermoanaerobaculia bacterium]|nr:transcriptional regulator [Thermoanaerobaculia bacterium]